MGTSSRNSYSTCKFHIELNGCLQQETIQGFDPLLPSPPGLLYHIPHDDKWHRYLCLKVLALRTSHQRPGKSSRARTEGLLYVTVHFGTLTTFKSC